MALGLYAILRSLGYHVSVGTRVDKPHMYRVRWTRQTLRKSATTVKSVVALPSDDEQYVYDLTTDNGHFHAGVGQMVVHNTDSVMIAFPGVSGVQACADLGVAAATLVTDSFPQRAADARDGARV